MEDIEENFLRTHLTILRFHKLWPEDLSKPIGLKDFIYVNFYYPISLYCILAYIHFYKTYSDPTINLTDDALAIIELTFYIFAFLMYFWRINDILLFYKNLRCFTKFGRPRNLEKLVEKQNKIMKIAYIYTIFSALIYAFYSFYSNEQCEKKASREGVPSSCSLVMPLWLPGNVLSNFYVRLCVFIVQTCFILCWFLPTVAATYCIASFTELLTSKVIHLRETLEEISTLPAAEEKGRKLIHCARYYNDIINLVDQSSYCFGHLNSGHFLLSSIILGLLYYRILTIFLLKDILQVCGWLLCIFILCYTGQQLINESEMLSNVIYSIEWLDMEDRSKHVLRLMMLRMQIPMNIQAGIFYAYSNEFLLRIVQASYTYVTVLNRIFNRNNTV